MSGLIYQIDFVRERVLRKFDPNDFLLIGFHGLLKVNAALLLNLSS